MHHLLMPKDLALVPATSVSVPDQEADDDIDDYVVAQRYWRPVGYTTRFINDDLCDPGPFFGYNGDFDTDYANYMMSVIIDAYHRIMSRSVTVPIITPRIEPIRTYGERLLAQRQRRAIMQ